MVTRVNGAPAQGFYFSKDVRTLTVVATNGDFVNDLQVKTTDPRQADVVNSGLEQALEAIATRATIIGLTVVNATTFHVLVDYANAFTAGNTEADAGTVEAALAADINAITAPINYANATVNTFAGFSGITPDTTP